MDTTDELGLHAYLETFTPRNMRFYQRLGLQEAVAFDEPGTKSPYWVMLREPS